MSVRSVKEVNPSYGAITKSLTDTKECISTIKQQFSETRLPVDDDSQVLQRFFAKLEYLLQYGFKEKTGILGSKKDYWDYIKECLSSSRSLKDSITYVKSNNEVKTSLGRGRALLRFALMHGRLADTLQHCVARGKITSEWYHSRAVWLRNELSSPLICALYDLNEVQFDLQPRGYDLDTAWPTFAHTHAAGAASHGWTPPLFTSSFNSLSNVSNQDSSYIPDSTRSDQEPSICHSDDGNEFWREKEEDYKFQLMEATSKIERLNNQVSTLKGEIRSANETEIEVDSSQNSSRVIAALKANLLAKEKTDLTKTKLIEFLERKLDGLERNEGGSNCIASLGQVSCELSTLKEQLEKETLKCEMLTTANSDLRTMLDDIQNNGAKIANLAKEKLRDYSNRDKEQCVLIAQLTNNSIPKDFNAASQSAFIVEKFKTIASTLQRMTSQTSQEHAAQVETLLAFVTQAVDDTAKWHLANAQGRKDDEQQIQTLESQLKEVKDAICTLGDIDPELMTSSPLAALLDHLLSLSLQSTTENYSSCHSKLCLTEREKLQNMVKTLKIELDDFRTSAEDQHDTSSESEPDGVSEVSLDQEEWREQVRKLRSDLTLGRQRMRQLLRGSEKEKESLVKELERLSLDRRALQAECDELFLKLDNTEDRLILAEGKLEDQSLLLGKLQVENEDMLEELNTRREEDIKGGDDVVVTEYKKQIDTLQKENQILLKRVSGSSPDSEISVDTLQQTLTELQANLAAKEDTIKQFEAAKLSQNAQLVDVEEQLQKATSERWERQSTLLVCQKENEQLKLELEKSMVEKEELNDVFLEEGSRLKALLEHAAHVREELEQQIRDEVVEKQDALRSMDRSEQRIEELQLEVVEKELLADELRLALASVKQELNKTEEDNANVLLAKDSELRTKLAEQELSFEHKLSQKEQELQTYMEEVTPKDSEPICDDVSATTAEEYCSENSAADTNLKEDFEKMAMELQEARKGHENELQSLQFQLSSMKLSNEQAASVGVVYETCSPIVFQLQETTQQQIKELQDQLVQKEKDLNTFKETFQQTKQELRLELNRLTTKYNEKEQENDLLSKEVSALKAEITDSKDKLLESETKLHQQTATSVALTTDADNLKRQLVKILRDKDSLWQRGARLEFMHRLASNGRWLEDKDIDACMYCGHEFSFTLRRHHCRLCGRIFCHSCCDTFVSLPHSNKKERVCAECCQTLESNSLNFLAENSSETNEDEEAVLQLLSPKWAADLSSSSTSDTDVKPTLHEEPDEPRPCSSQSLRSQHLVGSDNEDDVYDVITPLELSIAKESPNIAADPTLTVTSVVTMGQIMENCYQPSEELWIGPGKKYTVPIYLETEDSELTWEFTSYPKDIRFGVAYSETPAELLTAEELLPLSKCNSHVEKISGKLRVHKAGIYALSFDNSYSRFTSKKIEYTLKIKQERR